ncbi:nickel-dependent hydrogenase large subunit [Magnetococcus sp. PR-3]|uniref:nickel-dependent hydrogenase large subunit n=1 Tax=Magnetococcus sp. PR-3 TaxID=3120355 RepID=UPI002FCE28D0
MSLEGELKITIGVTEKGPNQVEIFSSRLVGASRVLEGKTIDEVLYLLPKLFVVCGHAQHVAGYRAIAALKGSEDHSSKQAQRIAMESVKEHLWRMLLSWPEAVGLSQDPQAMRSVLQTQQAHTQALVEGEGLSAETWLPLHTMLEEYLLGVSPQTWLAWERVEDLQQWAQRETTLAARMINHVWGQGMAAVGACASNRLPALSGEELGRSMKNSDFLAQPMWQGQCCESSCYSRTQSALLTSVSQVYGHGLISRLVARLTELCQLYEALRTKDPSLSQRLLPAAALVKDGAVGLVEAARGRLAHRVELAGEQVTSYRILAPTEWNFHPAGVVAQSLSGLRGEVATVQAQAHLLIQAVDPCVGYKLMVYEVGEEGGDV